MSEFIKHNATGFSDALICEAQGLELLADTLTAAGVRGDGALRVPRVIRVSESELVLPRIDTKPATADKMSALGEGLARLHQNPMPQYGFETDNMIGLSRQRNTLMDDWGDFFAEFRLRPQIAMINDSRVRREFESVLASCSSALREFLNQHCDQPSLLHGDLWAGNAIFDEQGPWLIDPAVYFGDREADIAMTELFGGFSPDFYQAYDSVWPRSDAYELKRPIYNLYHTLNHYNLFGASYLGACRENLDALRRL